MITVNISRVCIVLNMILWASSVILFHRVCYKAVVLLYYFLVKHTLQPTNIVVRHAGIVASVLIAIILIVIIVLKYIVFKLDPSYKVTEDKSYQQGASAALLGNQVGVSRRAL